MLWQLCVLNVSISVASRESMRWNFGNCSIPVWVIGFVLQAASSAVKLVDVTLLAYVIIKKRKGSLEACSMAGKWESFKHIRS